MSYLPQEDGISHKSIGTHLASPNNYYFPLSLSNNLLPKEVIK
jgi:hypothetical protein